MKQTLNRRQLLAAAGTAGALSLGAGLATAPTTAAEPKTSEPLVRFCLNTSTIRGQKLSLIEEVEIAGEAGYTGIEPWMRKITTYVQEGGSLKDLRKRIADAGLIVESAIGFANWIVDDDEQRAAGLEVAKRDMDVLRQIGGILPP